MAARGWAGCGYPIGKGLASRLATPSKAAKLVGTNKAKPPLRGALAAGGLGWLLGVDVGGGAVLCEELAGLRFGDFL